MAEFSRLVITNKGQALIAKIMMGKGNIVFTKVSASNAEYVLEELEALTELSDIRQTVPISKISRTNDVAITIESVFHNLELTEGYHMRALGLYATDPDEGEILYAVTMEISGNCYMPAYNGIAVSEAYIKLVTTVGNSESVSLEVDLAAVVTVGDMNSLRKEIVETYLPKDGDSAENTVTFDSTDSENVTSWTDVPVMESEEKHKSLFAKMSTMIKNVRFLYKLLGNKDISQIADGTVTGVLKEFKQALEGKVSTVSILKTIEQVNANTSAENIANALVIKSLKSDLTNSINQISSNLSGTNAKLNAYTDGAAMPICGNANTATSGWMRQSNASNNAINFPPDVYGCFLLTIKENDQWGAQLLLTRDSFNRLFVRNLTNGTWNEWTEK